MTRGFFVLSLLILLTSTESGYLFVWTEKTCFQTFSPRFPMFYSLISAFSLRDDAASSISLYPIFLGQGLTLPNQTEGY